jgi:molybdopterin converting factor small subunit
MASLLADGEHNEPDPGLPRVTVRYWASARAAAGVDEETFAGRNVAEVLGAAIRARHGDQRFERVLRISSILVGDQPVATRAPESVVLSTGDVLEILPPFAGG